MKEIMIGYSLYFLLAVGLTMLLSAAFRRIRREDSSLALPEEDAVFDQRMAKIEADYGIGTDKGPSRKNRPK